MKFNDDCIVRTARKTWKCEARQRVYDRVSLRETEELEVDHALTCPVVIPRGSRYVEDISYGGRFDSGRRYSMACAEALKRPTR